jgi:hypothetical protein
VVTIVLSGDRTLTSTNYEANEYRNAVLKFTDGGLSVAPTVTFPARQKQWTMINGTTYAITLSCGGVDAVLPAGLTLQAICDGTDMSIVRQRLDELLAPTADVAMNNQKLTGLTDGTVATDAATKGQLDAILNSADVATVAGISSDVTSVAGIASDVTAVASDASDIGTVSTNIADVNTVAQNMSDVQNASQVVAGFKPVEFTDVTTATTAQAGKAYRFRANVALTLPASPTSGDTISLIDGETVTDSAQPSLNPNGANIMGQSSNINLDVKGFDWLVWFNGSEWRLF